MANWRIVLLVRSLSPERRDLNSLRPEIHRGLIRTIYKKVVCRFKLFVDVPFVRSVHAPKKLLKLYKTFKQTSVSKFFIFAALRVLTGAEPFKSLKVGSYSVDNRFLPVKWRYIF